MNPLALARRSGQGNSLRHRQQSSVAQRAKAADPADAGDAAAEPRQLPVRSPVRVQLRLDIKIMPALPAPLRRAPRGDIYPFQDDLRAIGDHGSREKLRRPEWIGFSPSSMAGAYGW